MPVATLEPVVHTRAPTRRTVDAGSAAASTADLESMKSGRAMGSERPAEETAVDPAVGSHTEPDSPAPVETAATPAAAAVPAPEGPVAPSGSETDTEPAATEPATAEPADTESPEADVGVGEAVPAPASAAGVTEASFGADVPLLLPPAPAAPPPAQLSRIHAVTVATSASAASAKKLPGADATVGAARAAVTEPAAETSARAKAALAAELGAAPAPSPEIVKLADELRNRIRTRRPVKKDDFVSRDLKKDAAAAGATLTGTVSSETGKAADSLAKLNSEPTGSPTQVGVPLPAQSPGIPAPAAAAGTAAPTPIPPENLSLAGDVAATDRKIADSGISSPVTAHIPDAPFSTVRDGQAQLAGLAATGPAELAMKQDAAIASATNDMTALQAKALEALQSARAGTVSGVGEGQRGMVSGEKATRESVSKRAQSIFDGARASVDTLLKPLKDTALARWQAGLDRASTDFEQKLAKVKATVDERHEGVGGFFVAVWDAAVGMPEEITRAYSVAENDFADTVHHLLIGISTDVNAVVASAQAVIANARKRIDELFASLPAELREWAVGERAKFVGQLDGLTQRTDQARTAFVTEVTERAVDAVAEVQQKVEQLRAQAKGVLGELYDAIDAFLEDPARAIVNGLLTVLGIPPTAFWALVDKISGVIDDLSKDPQRLVDNLVQGVKEGFQAFFDHFPGHAAKGLWEWLFSGLKERIASPKDASPMSILSVLLQIMGLTWPRIRVLLVKHIGEKNVALIEKAWSIVSQLIQLGPDGVVQLVKDKLEPSAIVKAVLDAAIAFLIEKVVKNVALRIVGMLNPAGAVLQAVMLIYDVLNWIFTNAARIFTLVQTIVDGVADVIAGNLKAVSKAVEAALAMLIAPVIDFFAELLGLGDLPDKVAEVVQRLQEAVLTVVEQVIVFLVEQAQRLMKALGIDKGEKKDGKDDELGEKQSFTDGKEGHSLWIAIAGASATVMVASEKQTLDSFLAGAPALAAQRSKEDQATVDELVGPTRTLLKAVDKEADRLAPLLQAAKAAKAGTGDYPDDSQLEQMQRELAANVRKIMIATGAVDMNLVRAAVKGALESPGQDRATQAFAQWTSRIESAEAPPKEKIWPDPAAILKGSEADAVALLAHDATVNALIGWFAPPYSKVRTKEEIQNAAQTKAFGEYALVTGRPQPPHDVKEKFHDALGQRVVARLKAAATQKTAGDSDLKAKIDAIAFHAERNGYGRFDPWLGVHVDVRLKSAVATTRNDVLLFLKAIIVRVVTPLDHEMFIQIWRDGGETVTWFKDRLRAKKPGHHEWIPLSLVGAVVERAVGSAGPDDTSRTLAVKWIDALHLLRSPTSEVFWRLRSVADTGSEEAPAGPLTEAGIGAHVGALADPSSKKFRPVGTVGSADFHDWLRDRFTAATSATPPEYVSELKGAIVASTDNFKPEGTSPNAWLWNGTLSADESAKWGNEPIGVIYRVKNVPTGLTVQQLAAMQEQNYANILQRFDETQQALLAQG